MTWAPRLLRNPGRLPPFEGSHVWEELRATVGVYHRLVTHRLEVLGLRLLRIVTVDSVTGDGVIAAPESVAVRHAAAGGDGGRVGDVRRGLSACVRVYLAAGRARCGLAAGVWVYAFNLKKDDRRQ